MTEQAIIVSHGQPSEPDPAETALATLAARVAGRLPGWHVGSATLAKPGALQAALEQAGPHPLIYPMFMTAGWFTGEELLDRLNDRKAKVLPPLGLDAGLPEMAAELLSEVLAYEGWTTANTRLFIAAHGSGRSRNSARDTQAFATALAALMPLAEIRVGFVEEPPYLADMAFDLGPKSICLPFFAAKGGHVTDDIPEALDLAGFQGVRLEPIGCSQAVPALIARALEAARVAA